MHLRNAECPLRASLVCGTGPFHPGGLLGQGAASCVTLGMLSRTRPALHQLSGPTRQERPLQESSHCGWQLGGGAWPRADAPRGVLRKERATRNTAKPSHTRVSRRVLLSECKARCRDTVILSLKRCKCLA